MLPIEAAWVGAMIEGEGCVWRSKDRASRFWKISVVNTEVEVISGLIRATGVGNVYELHPAGYAKPHYLASWTWAVYKRNDVLSLVNQCFSYSTKLQKILKLMGEAV